VFNKLRRYILDAVQVEFQIGYEELRKDVISRNDYLYCHKDDTKTVTYEKL